VNPLGVAVTVTADGVDARAVEAERLYGLRARQLWSFGRRLGLDPGQADDAVHEAFARLVALPGPRWPVQPDAWLFRVVHNLAMDAHRRERLGSFRADVVDLMGPDDDGPGSEERMQRIAVWAAVDRLPTRQRAAIYLRYRADLDFSTIAHILGISESGARGDCFRALVSLRERVVRHG
jgi:RNA polymerase sigma factor (sigma-70 family)